MVRDGRKGFISNPDFLRMQDDRYLKDKTRRYVVFDVETTGLRLWRNDRIIEIGAVAVIGEDMVEEFCTLIDSDKPVTKAAQKVHGITREMLVGQPRAEEALTAFRQFVANSTLVAHNADFDIGFLGYEYSRIGQGLRNRHICTLKLNRKLYPQLPDYRLETVAKHILGIEIDEGRQHRALDDARLTARVWIKMRELA
jgi:DNA polymerase III epsilon subunit family exonuclease